MSDQITSARLKASRPDIYTYHDYREFLKDLFNHLKSTNPQFSIRGLSEKAEIAVGYFSMVAKGKRKLSENAMAKLLKLLPLSPAEQSYFKLIRTISDGDSQAVRIEALGRLQKFHEYQKLNNREIEVYRYLTNWYCVAIRELASLPDFNHDPKWIQERLSYTVPLSEISKAVDFLIEYGFLEKNAEGRLQTPNKRIECWAGVYSLSLGEFHRQMLELAMKSIETTPSHQRNITGHTLAIPSDKFKDVKKIMESAFQKVTELTYGQKDLDSVYHVGFVAFPVAGGK